MSSSDLMLLAAGAVLVPFMVSVVAALAVRRLAPGWGLLDHPNSRKVHQTPIALGGGLAIWAGVLVSFAVGQLALGLARADALPAGWIPEFARVHLDGLWAQSGTLWVLLAAGTVLMVTGLIDDLRGLSWQLRLGVQFVAAIVCVAFEPNLRLTAFVDWPWFTGGLSVIWIVALINSFNMLDNMDGLSSGVAAIAAGTLAAVLLLAPTPGTGQPQLFVAGLLLVVTGALLGFLVHNRPPARLFMGDAGSYFVGFMIAIATLLATFAGYKQGPAPHALLAPLLVMAVPFYDMVTVIWIRLRSGQSPVTADKNHFSHRLVELGLTKGQAVLTIYLTTATCGLAALVLHRVDVVGAAILLVLVLCVLALIAILESTARRKIKS